MRTIYCLLLATVMCGLTTASEEKQSTYVPYQPTICEALSSRVEEHAESLSDGNPFIKRKGLSIHVKAYSAAEDPRPGISITVIYFPDAIPEVVDGRVDLIRMHLNHELYEMLQNMKATNQHIPPVLLSWVTKIEPVYNEFKWSHEYDSFPYDVKIRMKPVR